MKLYKSFPTKSPPGRFWKPVVFWPYRDHDDYAPFFIARLVEEYLRWKQKRLETKVYKREIKG